MKIILVGCGKRKTQIDPCPAQFLYTGCLTKAAIGYAKARQCPWFIVSARYGLVEPTEPLRPYDFTIGDMDPAGRRSWALSVVMSLSAKPLALNDIFVEAHLGEEYLRYLRPALGAVGIAVEAPLGGLEVGLRLRWYEQQRAAGGSNG